MLAPVPAKRKTTVRNTESLHSRRDAVEEAVEKLFYPPRTQFRGRAFQGSSSSKFRMRIAKPLTCIFAAVPRELGGGNNTG